MSDTMQWLFESGHAVDIVLGVIALEAIVLKAQGWRMRELALLLLPGALILLGLRAALMGAEWYWIALPLIASLPAHLADVAQRKARKP